LTALVFTTGITGGDGGNSGDGNTTGAVVSVELAGKGLGVSVMAVVAGSTCCGAAGNARSDE
jgi:hypothetical protein